MVEEPELFCATGTDEGLADMPKSCAVTVMDVVCVRVPLVPVTDTV